MSPCYQDMLRCPRTAVTHDFMSSSSLFVSFTAALILLLFPQLIFIALIVGSYATGKLFILFYFILLIIMYSCLYIFFCNCNLPLGCVFKSVSPDCCHRVTEVCLIKHTHCLSQRHSHQARGQTPHTLTHSAFVDLVFFVDLCNWLNVNLTPKVHRSLCWCLLFVCVCE